MHHVLPRPGTRAHTAFTASSLMIGLGVLMVSATPAVWASPHGTVIRVEEDWVLVLNQPDDAVTAPQFHTVMSPFGSLDAVFAQVTWNYRELPDFTAGGLQIQAWNGGSFIVERSFGSNKMSDKAETVSWTQELETNGSQLSFTIRDGQSTTWGSFGYPANNMKIQGTFGITDLNGYDPDMSSGYSGISFGSNRVQKLVLNEVRYYDASGLLWVDSAPRVVFQLN